MKFQTVPLDGVQLGDILGAALAMQYTYRIPLDAELEIVSDHRGVNCLKATWPEERTEESP